MDKSVAVSNERGSSNHVPNDVVFSILSKLPLKSLKRFECVCKSWGLLFEDSHFMTIYRNNYTSDTCDDTSLLMLECGPKSELHLLSGKIFEKTVKLDWPLPFQRVDSYIEILNSVSINGILCLRQGIRKIVLWNPATKQFKVIPPMWSVMSLPLAVVQYHGFGFDRVRNDYKVIISVRMPPPRLVNKFSWYIYSLSGNSWRKLDANMPCPHRRMHGESFKVYLDGMCHWLGEWETQCDQESFETRYSDNECLISFDFSTEAFFRTSLSSSMDDSFDSRFVKRHLLIINESIALVSNYTNTATFRISILREIGVKESWIKLITFGPLPSIAYPVVFCKGGIFFRKEDGQLVWFDLSSKKIEERGIEGGNIVIYKESILPIEGKFKFHVTCLW